MKTRRLKRLSELIAMLRCDRRNLTSHAERAARRDHRAAVKAYHRAERRAYREALRSQNFSMVPAS